MTDHPILEGRGLRKAFGGVMAVAAVGLQAYPGEIVGLIGPNGAGKTTMFNLISGVHTLDAGEISRSMACRPTALLRWGLFAPSRICRSSAR